MAGDEIKTLERDSTPKGQDSSTEKESNSERTYSGEEHKKAVEDAIAQYGERIKKERIDPVVTERDALQSRLADIEDNAEEIEKLQAKLDAMGSDDPEKFDLVKELKASREERKQLKADRALLEQDKQAHAESIKLASDTLREISIFDISAEYEGGNPEKLKALCDTFNTSAEAEIRKVADTLWEKKKSVPAGKEPLKLTTPKGGGIITDAQIVADWIKDPYNPTYRARYYEYLGRKK